MVQERSSSVRHSKLEPTVSLESAPDIVWEGLVASGILSADERDQLQADSSLDVVCQRLLENRRLSAYQEKHVLAGRAYELLVGEYTLIEPLGEGGMGVVFLAQHRRMRRQVAIKFLPERFADDPQRVKRFEREVAVAAQLTHPNIVPAYDAGEHGSRLFLVMQYVEGCDLATVLREHGPLAPQTALRCILQTCLAMDYAHQKGIIHRDLKPGNLMLAVDGMVHVLDLGLASWGFEAASNGDSALSATGAVMGTIEYMAPEQAANAKAVDARSDIYSLGCTWYALIHGKPPYGGETVVERLLAHREAPIPPLLADDAPEAISWNVVLERMLAKQPDQRFSTMQELESALRPLLSDTDLSVSLLLPDRSGDLTIDLPTTSPVHGIETKVPQPAIDTSHQEKSRKSRRRWLVALAALAIVGGSFVAWQFWLGGKNNAPELIEGPLPQDVLLVGQTGRVHFTKIGDALRHVGPGMTIRVIDDGVYEETLAISNYTAHRGITLEATQGATIRCDDPESIALLISDVPNIVLRGFRFDVEGAACVLLGAVSGLILEDLTIEGDARRRDISSASDYSSGISLEGITIPPSEPPVTVRRCTIRNLSMAIRLSGINNDYRTFFPSNNVLIHDCHIGHCAAGINLAGDIRWVIVAANVIHDCSGYGIQLEQLSDESNEILVANNSMYRCVWPFRIWSQTFGNGDVEVVGNVSLESGQADWLFIDSGGDRMTPVGPGDILALSKAWRFTHNFRERDNTAAPSGVLAEAWLPPSSTDHESEQIGMGSRDQDSTDFLRPPTSSNVAQGGQGDPLPRYAGARPPLGGQADTDWQAVFANSMSDASATAGSPSN